jgi:hypothetical protein
MDTDVTIQIPLSVARKMLASLESSYSQMNEAAWGVIRRCGDDSPEDCAMADALGELGSTLHKLRDAITIAEAS